MGISTDHIRSGSTSEENCVSKEPTREQQFSPGEETDAMIVSAALPHYQNKTRTAMPWRGYKRPKGLAPAGRWRRISPRTSLCLETLVAHAILGGHIIGTLGSIFQKRHVKPGTAFG